MMRKNAHVEKASAGTVLAEGNKLTDAEREKLIEKFPKRYHGDE